MMAMTSIQRLSSDWDRVVLAMCFVAALISCHAHGSSFKALPQTSTQTTDFTLAAGLTHFRFTDWAGPEVPVWVYVPHSVNARNAPIMFLMHGAKRAPARYLSEWDEIAEKHGFVVVAPEFSKRNFPKSDNYNSGGVFDRNTKARNDESLWSFSVIEPIFDAVVAALDSRRKRYVMFGHSAGSQFAHRFMIFKPQARVSRFLFANAGWYTMLDLDEPFPYGLGGLSLSNEELADLLARDVVVLLGDQDNDASHSSLRRTEEANRQGVHRFARGQSYFRHAKSQSEALGVNFGWQLRVVPGVAHSNGGIAFASGDLIE